MKPIHEERVTCKVKTDKYICSVRIVNVIIMRLGLSGYLLQIIQSNQVSTYVYS